VSRAPNRRPDDHWWWDHYKDNDATPENVQAHVEDRDPDKIIYGPRGEVLKRVADRPMQGYRRRPKT
jgi:hypothetical protein